MPAFFNRPVHVRIEDDAVAHPDRHTVLDADVISRRHLRRRELRARPLTRGERPLGDSAQENEGKNQQTEASQRTHRGAPFGCGRPNGGARQILLDRNDTTVSTRNPVRERFLQPNGKELFYLDGINSVMVVPVQTSHYLQRWQGCEGVREPLCRPGELRELLEPCAEAESQ